MDDPIPVALESGPYGMEFFGTLSPHRIGVQTSFFMEGFPLELFDSLPYRHLFSRPISRRNPLLFPFIIFCEPLQRLLAVFDKDLIRNLNSQANSY